MAIKYPMPDVWVALPDGSGIIEYDLHAHGLDLEPDDDKEPAIMPPWIVQVLGFDPLEEPGIQEPGITKQKLIFDDRKGSSSHAGRITGSAARRNLAAIVNEGRSTDPIPPDKQPGPDTGTGSTNVAGRGSPVVFGRSLSSTFYKTISDAVKGSNAGAVVHVYEPGEYAEMRCYLTPDKTAGYALKGDEIVSVFKHPDSPHKKVVITALAQAVKQGGRRLDCFDTVLPGFYSNNHFRAVARIKWNDDYAPEGWDYDRMAPFNNGRPDVVLMVYDPTYKQLYKPDDGELADDYDEAEAIQKAASRYGPASSNLMGLKGPNESAFAPGKPEYTSRTADAFEEGKHPRGQPENKGEFAKTGGGASTAPSNAPAQSQALFTPQEMTLPTNASQPVSTPEELSQGTITAQDQLAAWMDKGKGVAAQLGYSMESQSPSKTDLNQPGGMLFMGRPKSMERSAQKVQSDYGGDWSKLLDPVRCTFACDNFGEVHRVLQALKASGMKLARRPKDRFANPTEAGYRDCLLNVVLPNGMIGEVQIHSKAMLQAKAEGHKWYEIERTLDAESKTRNLTVEERQQRSAASEQMNRIYADAWAASTKGQGKDAARPMEPYTYYDYDNAYFRRINRNGLTRSIDEVLHGNRWVAYTGDCLAPVVFGDRCGDPLAQGTGDADFKEEDHPRGQPGNKGQFAEVQGSGSSGSPEPGIGRKDLSPRVKAFYEQYVKLRDKAKEIDSSDAPRAEKEAAWKTAEEAYNSVERAHKRRELAEAERAWAAPGKVIKRPRPATTDAISDFAVMEPDEFRKKSGMSSVRDKTDENRSRVLSAVGKTRAAIMGLPKSHRDKLNEVLVRNQYTIEPSVRADVDTGQRSGYAGMYYFNEKRAEIVDFVSTRDGQQTFMLEDTQRVTVHELGHAMDGEFSLALSGSAYLNEAINADTKGLTEKQRHAADYYLGNSREMVAETYSMCFSNSDRAFGMPKSEAWDAFKNTRERLGALLQQKGLDVYAGILAA